MSEFTGEQKLRIVLESLLRDVPKKDQCKKYGITESEFDEWNDKLIKDGGTIYETSSEENFPSSRPEGSLWSKSVLIVSILINLLLVAGVVSWYFFFNPHSGSTEYLRNENNFSKLYSELLKLKYKCYIFQNKRLIKYVRNC